MKTFIGFCTALTVLQLTHFTKGQISNAWSSFSDDQTIPSVQSSQQVGMPSSVTTSSNWGSNSEDAVNTINHSSEMSFETEGGINNVEENGINLDIGLGQLGGLDNLSGANHLGQIFGDVMSFGEMTGEGLSSMGEIVREGMSGSIGLSGSDIMDRFGGLGRYSGSVGVDGSSGSFGLGGSSGSFGFGGSSGSLGLGGSGGSFGYGGSSGSLGLGGSSGSGGSFRLGRMNGADDSISIGETGEPNGMDRYNIKMNTNNGHHRMGGVGRLDSVGGPNRMSGANQMNGPSQIVESNRISGIHQMGGPHQMGRPNQMSRPNGIGESNRMGSFNIGMGAARVSGSGAESGISASGRPGRMNGLNMNFDGASQTGEMANFGASSGSNGRYELPLRGLKMLRRNILPTVNGGSIQITRSPMKITWGQQ